MKDRASRRMAWLVMLIVTVVVLDRRANAQFRAPTSKKPEVYNIFQPAPRELRRPLSLARQALEDNRYTDAVILLGELLINEEAEDYFVGPLGEAGTQTSLKAEAQRLIGTMPKQGRQRYEEQFGVTARSILNAALKTGEAGKLTQVSRKFFHTAAGYEATMLLGRYHLDRGRPLAAALSFKRVLGTGHADQYEPELSIMLATCWLYSNMPEEAEKTLLSLKKRLPRASFQVGDTETKLFEDPRKALPWITKLIGAREALGGAKEEQWVVFRGNASRNASTSGSFPLLSHRWELPAANDPSDKSIFEKLNRNNRVAKVPVLPGIHPLAVGDILLYRTPYLLLGVELKKTEGKRIWQFPWSEGSDSGIAPNSATNNAVQRGISPREDFLKQRLYNDALYGQISSDGQSVFFLDALGSATYSTNNRVIFPGGVPRANQYSPRNYNELVALSLQKQGSLLWKVGGADGEDEEKLAGAFFLGAPLPLQGSLYVLAEINSEIRLVVLDAKTGKQQWSQQLAHVESSPILRDLARRLAGATPSFADGVLMCPTSKGAVVAVDLSTRSLLWGYQYGQVGSPQMNRFGMINSTPNRPQGGRWADASVTIAEGRVLLTPIESDQLHCLDLLTGKSVWPAPTSRGEMLYLACVHKGRVVLVGKNSVTAINLKNGQTAWTEPINIDGMPSGRGFYSDHYYFLPTTKSELIKIDLEAGKIAHRVKTDRVLGNLICHRDEIISANVDWIASYFQSEPLRAKVTERLAKNPDDPWALARQGELLMHEGKQAEALVALRRAYQLDPSQDATRMLLVRTMLAALRDDFEANRNVASELEGLIDLPPHKSEYLRLMAVGLQKSGNTEEAFHAYLKFASFSEIDLQSGQSSLESTEPNLRVRRDHWVRSQLFSLMAQAKGPFREKMDQAILERLETVLKEGSSQTLERFLGYFGTYPLADRARATLVVKLVEEDELLAAELLLSRLIASGDESLAASATAQMARLLEKAERFPEAVVYYHLLADKWSDAICLEGKTGKQLFQSVVKDSEVGRLLHSPRKWLTGKTQVKELNSSSPYQMAYPVKFRYRSGPSPRGINVILDAQRNQVIIRDGQGNRIAQVLLNRQDRRRFNTNEARIATAQVNGHLMLLSLGYEIVAIDLLRAKKKPTEAILWRYDTIASRPPSPNRVAVPQTVQLRSTGNPWGESRYYGTDSYGRRVGEAGPLNEHGVCYFVNGELTCVDPISGDPLWVRSGFDANSEIFGDDEMVFVAANNGDEAIVISAIDGHLLGKKKIDRSLQRWATYGRRMLGWVQDGNHLKLTLRDVWTETDLWSHQYPLGSKGRLIDSEEVAIMQPDGHFHILSLVEGKLKVDAALEKESSLTTIYVQRSSDQYILVVAKPVSYGTQNMNFQPAPNPTYSPMIDGSLYAFDRQTGESLWDVPAKIERYGFPLDQPEDLPVLVFLRNVTKINPRTRQRTTQASVLCIDRRDGRVIIAKDDLPQPLNFYRVFGNPEQQSVTLVTPRKTFTITLTADPTPPEPPAQTGSASSLQASAVDSKAKSQTAAVKRDDPFGGADRPALPAIQLRRPIPQQQRLQGPPVKKQPVPKR